MEIMEYIPRVPMPAKSNSDNLQQKSILISMLLSNESGDKTREAKENSHPESLLERLERLHTLQQTFDVGEHGGVTIWISEEITDAEKLC